MKTEKNKITRKQLSAQITIETAIVLPVVMMMVASLMNLCLYIHDGVSIKSYAYAIGNREINRKNQEFEKCIREEIVRIPLFLMRIQNVHCSTQGSQYIIKINMEIKNQLKWMDNILKIDSSEYIVKIEKNMENEILYAGRAICDGLEKERK